MSKYIHYITPPPEENQLTLNTHPFLFSRMVMILNTTVMVNDRRYLQVTFLLDTIPLLKDGFSALENAKASVTDISNAEVLILCQSNSLVASCNKPLLIVVLVAPIQHHRIVLCFNTARAVFILQANIQILR